MNRDQILTRKPLPMRTVAAGAVAAVLLASSFSAVRGGTVAGYDVEDSGLSGGEMAGIAIAGGTAAYFIATTVMKDDKDEESSSSSAAKSRKVESVRVTPQNVRLERGAAQDFQVQVRYVGEKDWQNVTNSPSASLRLSGDSGRFVSMDGAKNVFTAPIDARGGPASLQVVGSFGGSEAVSMVALQ